MLDAGLSVLVSFLSPFRTDGQALRSRFARDEFLEVFVDALLADAEERDPRGLYEKGRGGQLANFTGIDSPYEPPEGPEIQLDTTCLAAEDARRMVIEELERRGRLEPPVPRESSGLRKHQPWAWSLEVALLLLAIHRCRCVVVDQPTLPLGRRGREHLANYFGRVSASLSMAPDRG